MARSTLKRSSHTNGKCAHYFPIIPKMESIFQFSLVQVTVRVLIGNYCQPNQLDAPFSLAKLTALFVLAGREFLHSSDRLSSLSSFSFFASSCSSVISASSAGSCSCDIIRSARGAVTLTDAWNSAFSL